MAFGLEPSSNCRRCPRLVSLRRECRLDKPDWHNAPVEGYGSLDSWLLVIGLAPGRRGANRTGRPFTGDAAGGYLFDMLGRFDLASGTYQDTGDDDVRLHGTRITNVVRCLPPANKPIAAEVNACRAFLKAEIAAMPKLDTILTLGRVAHDSACHTLGFRLADVPFGHGHCWHVETGGRPMRIVSSFHCSRYNTQTGRLTEEMFADVFRLATKS